MRAERGAALVMVLLVVAAITVTAVTINENVRFNTRRLYNQRLNEQAYWYAQGGEQLVRRLLQEVSDKENINLEQAWATRDAVFPIDGGAMAGVVEDMHGCFNVNRLQRGSADADSGTPQPTRSEREFEALLSLLGVASGDIELIKQRLLDWIDADLMPQGANGAEDLYYSNLKQPFQAANQAMASISELDLLVDMEAEDRAKFIGYLCALPEADTVVNVNTLPPERAALLAALLDNQLAVEEMARLLQQRPAAGWESVDAFLASEGLQGKEFPEDLKQSLGVKSAYFRATIDVNFHETQLRMISRLRLGEGGVTVYAREYGERL